MNYEEFCSKLSMWVIANIDPEITITRYPDQEDGGNTGKTFYFPDLHFEAARNGHFSSVSVDLAMPELYDLFRRKDWTAVEKTLGEELGSISMLKADEKNEKPEQERTSGVRPILFPADPEPEPDEILPVMRRVLLEEENKQTDAVSSASGKKTVMNADKLRRMLDMDRQELFDRLRILRAKTAAEHAVPPYIIFSNRSLYEMCRDLPDSMQEFRAVRGVGVKNSSLYGSMFLDEIRAYKERKEIFSAGEVLPEPAEDHVDGDSVLAAFGDDHVGVAL